jgi:hypothetical protein
LRVPYLPLSILSILSLNLAQQEYTTG